MCVCVCVCVCSNLSIYLSIYDLLKIVDILFFPR